MSDNRHLNEKQLQALLRLKRFEQPPPGYFDDLLVSVQMRQREQMLEPHSLTRAGLDRLKAWWASMDWNYAASMAGILLMGIVAIQIALPRRNQLTAENNVANTQLASANSPFAQVSQAVEPSHGRPGSPSTPAAGLEKNLVSEHRRMLSLQPSRRGLLEGDEMQVRFVPGSLPVLQQPGKPQTEAPTRYVIDPQPVSFQKTRIRF